MVLLAPDARESNYTGESPESKNSNFDHFTEALGDVVTPRARVSLRMGATNEIRLTWGQEPKTANLPWARSVAIEGEEGTQCPLVYTDELQPLATGDVQEPKRRLQKALTKYAKRTIREGCAVVKQTGEKPGAFLTATVPGSTKEAIRCVSENSQRLMNDLMEKLRKAHNRFYATISETPPPFLCTTVWEPQKRGMLHCHTVFQCDNSKLYKHIKAHWKLWWRQVLENLSDETGVDLFQNLQNGSYRNMEMYPIVECKRIKKDIGRYMSKYMTKGVEDSAEPTEEGLTRWWYMSRPLLNLVKDERRQEKIPTECLALAEQLALDAVLVAMPFASDVLLTQHPKFGTACGAILYVEEKDKEHVFVRMSEVLYAAEEALKRAGFHWNEKGEYEYSPKDAEMFADFECEDESCFFGAFVSADLCAPFSAPEKGGGMRYH